MCDSSPLFKVCTTCQQQILATPEFFAAHKSGKYGLQACCRVCKKVYEAEYRLKNPEKSAEKNRKNYQKNRQAITNGQYAWRRANPEKYALRQSVQKKRKYWANPEKSRKKMRDYRAANPEITRAIKHRRRSREYAGGSFSASDVILKFEQQRSLCYWCSSLLTDDRQIDHIIPLAKGGLNSANNICLSCANCNRSKSARMPWEFKGRLL